MAATVIPVVLKLEQELLPEEISLVKAFIGLFHKKGTKTQAVSVSVPATPTAPAHTLTATEIDEASIKAGT